LSTYRSKNDPELRVAGQDEAIPIFPALNENEANRSQARDLTRRQREIARFVAAGLSNKQIALKASIAEATVKLHLHKAYKKLGIANRATLAVMVSSDPGAWGQGQ
jgi:DNA-binding NarL/FixJ family response regulator